MKRPSKRARGDTYADRVIDRLDAGKVHASLGPKLKTGSADRARKKVNRLVKTGLKPNHFVVDYGCGTLRVGALLIAYLEPDRYCGLDIDQRFLDIGREMLPEGLANSKRPLLRVISPAAIAEVGARDPDLIVSTGVLQHVSPGDLSTYFGNLSALATQRTTIELRVSKPHAEPTQLTSNTWAHSLASLESAVQLAGMAVKSFKSSSGKSGMLQLVKL